MTRFFSSDQKMALRIHAGGRCQMCGKPLGEHWHADHIKPFSKGGATDVLNGQALCPECNLKKGDRFMELRDWQVKFVKAFLEQITKNQSNFLLVATPGAGKTTSALYVAKKRKESGAIQRIVVVVPSTQLKDQWSRAAHETFGLDLTVRGNKACKEAGIEPNDTDGMIVSYAQVSTQPHLHRMFCERETFVIFDEIHHCGDSDSLPWGAGIKYAFEHAKYTLAMSGTPFRSDNHPIPFVKYEGGNSVADFSYGYSEALDDGVCRAVFFPSYDGRTEWCIDDTEFFSESFDDDLDSKGEAKRLRTALSTRGDFLWNMFNDANKRLQEIRRSDEDNRNAAGLIVAIDQIEAKKIAAIIESKYNISPVVVISDDDSAHDKIEAFKNSDETWLIAVRMVSEGIDIPRLVIGVYATNITQELFFRQFVGRFVRGSDSAWIYLPKDNRLISLAEKIKEERDHILIEKEPDETRPMKELSPDENPEWFGLGYMPISSQGDIDSVIHDGQYFSKDDLQMINELRSRVQGDGLNDVDDQVLFSMFNICMEQIRGRFGDKGVSQPATPIANPVKKERGDDTRKRLKTIINNKVNRIAFLRKIEPKNIHYAWLKRGGKSHDKSSIADLERKIAWLTSLT